MTSLSTQLDISALVEMGFTKDRVELAVKSVKNPDIQTVVEWLFNHPIPDNDNGHRLGDDISSKTPVENSNGSQLPPAPVSADMAIPVENDEVSNDSVAMHGVASESPDSAAAATAPALSLVCEDCGKQIRNEMDAQTHAARTGHQNFAESSEEIKPLTAEEKEAQKIRLQQKLEERRKDRELAEKEQEKLREKNRRKTGQEVSQAKDEHAYKEMKRIAEERRQDKLEEKRLKQKLKEDIARDRAEFKKQNTSSNVANASATQTSKAAEKETLPTKKEYNTSRIQFRLVDGSTQNSNFNADDPLQVVYNYISEKIMDNISFDLCMTFPRKIFSEEDKGKTLKELGLVPSAALVLKKCM